MPLLFVQLNFITMLSSPVSHPLKSRGNVLCWRAGSPAAVHTPCKAFLPAVLTGGPWRKVSLSCGFSAVSGHTQCSAHCLSGLPETMNPEGTRRTVVSTDCPIMTGMNTCGRTPGTLQTCNAHFPVTYTGLWRTAQQFLAAASSVSGVPGVEEAGCGVTVRCPLLLA